ncbi:MAG: ABC transporter ATP-binding protein [Deltaproteobacteria bacterium]|nr:ABC transporter ATP-binding protein [Deltaproteobacteria bacterium]
MVLLEVLGLTHDFGGLRAVERFNLKLEEGELLGLIGPNGAGKTTLFNLTCGFYEPSEGEIRFLGKTIAGLRPHAVTALGIARTFQNIRLWSTLTVFENVCISQHHRLGYGFLDAILRTKRYRECEGRVRRSARELMEILDLEDYADEAPGNLAYGLQRRVELCRALSVRPRLLLLDEPAAGMNPGEAGQLIETIRWIRERFGLTIWLIEHQMRVVMSLCDRIQVLDFGKTIAQGTPSDIRRNEAVIKAYLGGQESTHASS